MLTQCPNCETTFRVTAEILRVADGQVRCGRCHTQFDALERLLEEGDADAAESGRFLQSPSRTHTEAIEVEEPDSMEDITLEGKHIEISGTYRVLDANDPTGSHLHQEITEEWAEIDDDDPDDDDTGPTIEPANEVIEPHDDTPSEAFDTPPAAPPPRIVTRTPLGARLNRTVTAEEHDDLSLFAAPERRKSNTRIWAILVAPLAVLLAAQIVHHNRAELARHPRVGSPLMSIYETLGLTLTPDWDLHAYGVKQWGVAMDPASPGTLVVRASITNGAAFAQPYPLLKLVLEDRWGDQVRAREFEPAEYLDAGTAPDRLLSPSQQTNATISIVDPGPDAEGFRFDVCLRGKSGPVCAAEVPAR